ncbi:MAG: cytochrome-c oxidase, cbb3-type subunit III [Zoogloeaceae bacterium]|jgi:cytochrome c oxidase cbb3-type subunit 3|nr:cytochrome-c oxidase, cbb3-type subunit III [Zoogloeaceae bacterium]
MSDFTNAFWSFYVIGIVVAAIIVCLVLLVTSTSVTYTAGKTTGHSWDEDLQEFNNPLPKWWIGLFYLTLVFAIGYLAYFPGLGSFAGLGGWSSAIGANSQYEREVKAVNAVLQPTLDKYLQQDLKTVAADPTARAMGQRLFQAYCIQCHGSDAKGGKGFPNLTDADWQWGGEPERIEETIAQGRDGVMTAHAELLTDEQTRDIAYYVRTLSSSADDLERAERGKVALYGSDCKTCHATDFSQEFPPLTGSPLLGGPNLTDTTWLYSSSESEIIHGIKNGRQNRMPAWEGFLGKGKVRLLAAYVYGLSNR